MAKHYLYIILILMWGMPALFSPLFRSASTLSAVLVSAVSLVFIGFAQTTVVLMGGFDLSVGSVASMATVICSVLMEKNLVLAIFIVLLAAMIVGALNGVGITFFRIEPFIMTMGMMFILSGVNMMIRPSPGGYISPILQKILFFSIGDMAIAPALIIIVVGIIGSTLLNKTAFGREVYAVGGNPKGALMSGINITKTRIMAYIVSAVASALGGIFIACRISSGNSDAGASCLFDSFIVVFMGGTMVTGGVGGFSGTLASCLIIASLVYILQLLGVSSWYQFIVKGALLVVVASIHIIIHMKRRME